MCPCDPSTNNINIPQPGPSPFIPGLGLPFSVPKLPFPDLTLPDSIPESILDLIERIFALFPQGIKFEVVSNAMTKDVWDALANIFNQLSPFLAFYKFIQALLNIILCIIDVLCALVNPWATLRAVRRLFSQCIPNFLSLFPWLALLIMILALILLLIALIEYIIGVIIAYIKQIIQNILVLSRAIQVHDEQAILAAVNKLAYILCLIEGLFSILMAIAALFAIIKPLMGILGRSVCGPGDSCCTDDFCPPFIRNEPTGMRSISGKLAYFNRIEPIVPPGFGFLSGNVALRAEKIQFVDDNPGEYKFLDVITPSTDLKLTYWPEGESYDGSANTVRVPYLLDMDLWMDPASFGNPQDTAGYRQFSVQDIIVHQRPTKYPTAWDNTTDTTNGDGALVLLGGKVFEIVGDGYAAYNIGGTQATLETLLHKDTTYENSLPVYDDGYYFLDVSYNFRFNYETLWQKGLIGTMCQPETAAESAVTNAEFADQRSVFDKVGDLPDVNGTVTCLTTALAKFRKGINNESAALFQSEAITCLNNLKAQAEDFYCRGAAEAADRFTSDFELDPTVQFTKHEIGVTVRLRDKTGTQLAVNVPQGLGDCLSNLVTAHATFGTVSSFTYDGYGNFVATLNSDAAGSGELTAFLKNEVFATVVRSGTDTPSEIVTRVLPYEFIDKTTVYRKEESDEGRRRFGPPDIAKDGE